MKKAISLFLLSALTVNLYAQNLKQYSGEMKGGTITFTYYEDEHTLSEKRHGTFKYVKNLANDISKYSLTITGHYSHGYMDGQWRYTINETDYPEGNAYVTSTTKAQMSFKDGVPNGPWTYSYKGKGRLQHFSLLGWSWGPYETLPTETASVTFRNGTLVGPMSIKTNAENITGTLNEKGFWIGNWISLNGNSRSEYTLTNDGLMTKGIGRYNGRIVSSAGLEPELKALFDEYKTLPTSEQREKFCRKHHIKIDTTRCTYPTLFDRDFGFIYDYACEDKTLQDEEGNRVDLRNYGRYIQIKRIEPISFDEAFPGYLKQVDSFEARFKTYGWQLNEEDWQRAQTIIAQWKAYDTCTAKIQEIRPKLSINIEELSLPDNTPLRFATPYFPLALNNYARHLTDQWAYALQQASNGIFLVKKNTRRDTWGNTKEYTSYQVLDFDMHATTDYLAADAQVYQWMTKYEPKITSAMDSLQKVCSRASAVSVKIAQLYEETHVANQNKDIYPNTYALFDKYNQVLDYLWDSISEAHDFETVTNLIEQIDHICDNMLDKTSRAHIRKALRKNKNAPIKVLVDIMSE